MLTRRMTWKDSVTYIFEKAFKFEHYMLFISKESEEYFWMYFVWTECKEFLPNNYGNQRVIASNAREIKWLQQDFYLCVNMR